MPCDAAPVWLEAKLKPSYANAGAEAPAAANGELTLQGFSGSAVSSLTISVNDYASLKKLVHDQYSGRLESSGESLYFMAFLLAAGIGGEIS